MNEEDDCRFLASQLAVEPGQAGSRASVLGRARELHGFALRSRHGLAGRPLCRRQWFDGDPGGREAWRRRKRYSRMTRGRCRTCWLQARSRNGRSSLTHGTRDTVLDTNLICLSQAAQRREMRGSERSGFSDSTWSLQHQRYLTKPKLL